MYSRNTLLRFAMSRLIERLADNLVYSATCRCCEGCGEHCAGHISIRHRVTGEDRNWPERVGVELTESYSHEVVTQGIDNPRVLLDMWTLIDVKEQRAYGPEFKTLEELQGFVKWFGDEDTSLYPDMVLHTLVDFFRQGLPAPRIVSDGNEATIVLDASQLLPVDELNDIIRSVFGEGSLIYPDPVKEAAENLAENLAEETPADADARAENDAERVAEMSADEREGYGSL